MDWQRKSLNAEHESKPQWLVSPDFCHILAFEAILETVSPLAIGSDDDHSCSDRPVIRRENGAPFIPGSSMAGVIRSILAKSFDKKHIDSLFGDQIDENIVRTTESADEKPGKISRIHFDDLDLDGGSEIERRDHVRIDSNNGIAMKGKKYDIDSVAIGACFKFRMEVFLDQYLYDAPVNRIFIATILSLLSDQDQPLMMGGHTRKGFGRVVNLSKQASFGFAMFDIGKPSGLLQYMNFLDEARKLEVFPLDKILKILKVGSVQSLRKNFCELSITLDMKIVNSLIIRGPAVNCGGKKAPDASHLRRKSKTISEKIIPATSMLGPIRHRAGMICRTLGKTDADIQNLLTSLFGSQTLQEFDSSKDTYKPSAGILFMNEMVIQDDVELRHTRVSIDPWTGGALDHCLFTEDVLYGGCFRMEMQIRPRSKNKNKDSEQHESMHRAAIGLLFLALRDLWEGDLPIGGESSVGRGVLNATSGYMLDKQGERMELRFEQGKLVQTPELILDYVRSFSEWIKKGNM